MSKSTEVKTTVVGSESGQANKASFDVNRGIDSLTALLVGLFGKDVINNHYYDSERAKYNDTVKYVFWFMSLVVVLLVIYFLFKGRSNKKK